MEGTLDVSQEEPGLNLDTTTSAVSYSANYVSTLSFSFFLFEEEKIVVIIFIKHVMRSSTHFTCMNSLNPHNDSLR